MLKEFVLPPGSILVVAGLLFLLARRRPRGLRALFLAVLGLFYLLSTPMVSGRLLQSLDWYPAILPGQGSPGGRAAGALAGAPPEAPPGAIVVLAAGRLRNLAMYGGDTVDTLTLERLRFAARLHHATGLPVLATGGPPPEPQWPRPMAALMEEVLRRDFGVREVWTEGRSTNTAENAEFSAAELLARSIDRAYLVTHGWHLPRAVQSFRRTGLAVIPAPATAEGPQGLEISDVLPNARAFAETAYALHEWIGLAWYRLRYPPR